MSFKPITGSSAGREMIVVQDDSFERFFGDGSLVRLSGSSSDSIFPSVMFEEDKDPTLNEGVQHIKARLATLNESEFVECLRRAASEDRDAAENIFARLNTPGLIDVESRTKDQDRLKIARTLLVLAPSTASVGILAKIGAAFSKQIQSLISWFQDYKAFMLHGEKTERRMGKCIKDLLVPGEIQYGSFKDSSLFNLEEAKRLVAKELVPNLQKGSLQEFAPYWEFKASLADVKQSLVAAGNTQEIVNIVERLEKEFSSIVPGKDPKDQAQKHIGEMLKLINKKIEVESKKQAVNPDADNLTQLQEMNRLRKVESYNLKIATKTKKIKDLKQAYENLRGFSEVIQKLVDSGNISDNQLKAVNSILNARMEKMKAENPASCDNDFVYQELQEYAQFISACLDDNGNSYVAAPVLDTFVARLKEYRTKTQPRKADEIATEEATLKKYKAKLAELNAPVQVVKQMDRESKIAQDQLEIAVAAESLRNHQLAFSHFKFFLKFLQDGNFSIQRLEFMSSMLNSYIEKRAAQNPAVNAAIQEAGSFGHIPVEDFVFQNLQTYLNIITNQINLINRPDQIQNNLVTFLEAYEGKDQNMQNWEENLNNRVVRAQAEYDALQAKLAELTAPIAAPVSGPQPMAPFSSSSDLSHAPLSVVEQPAPPAAPVQQAASSSAPAPAPSFLTTMKSLFSFGQAASKEVGQIDLKGVNSARKTLSIQVKNLSKKDAVLPAAASAARGQLITSLEKQIVAQQKALDILNVDRGNLAKFIQELTKMHEKYKTSAITNEDQEIKKLFERISSELSEATKNKIYEYSYIKMQFGQKLAQRATAELSKEAIGKNIFDQIASRYATKPLSFESKADQLKTVNRQHEVLVKEIQHTIKKANELVERLKKTA